MELKGSVCAEMGRGLTIDVVDDLGREEGLVRGRKNNGKRVVFQGEKGNCDGQLSRREVGYGGGRLRWCTRRGL